MKQQLIYGNMGIGGGWNQEPLTESAIKQAEDVIKACLDIGIKTFDHADIYQFGKAESAFGQAALNLDLKRSDYVLQTKAAIDLTQDITTYNMTGEYITKALTDSLERLQTYYVDYFILHRPDPLCDIKSLKQSLHHLKGEGKFLHLGVSNMNHHQIEYLQNALDMQIDINQLEMSLLKHGFVEQTILVNHPGYHQVDFPGGTLEYCMTHGVALQAWGASGQGIFSKEEEASPEVAAARAYLNILAKEKKTSIDSLVLQWLMQHPAAISPVVGTTKAERIRFLSDLPVKLSRREWFTLLKHVRGNQLP